MAAVGACPRSSGHGGGRVKMEGLRLYSRAGCHLCEDAEAALAGLGIPFERLDITGNADYEHLYGWDVPVLVRLPEGEVLAKGVITAARLLKVLGEEIGDRV